MSQLVTKWGQCWILIGHREIRPIKEVRLGMVGPSIALAPAASFNNKIMSFKLLSLFSIAYYNRRSNVGNLLLTSKVCSTTSDNDE